MTNEKGTYTLRELVDESISEMRKSKLVETIRSVTKHVSETIGLPYFYNTIHRRIAERESNEGLGKQIYIKNLLGAGAVFGPVMIATTNGDIRNLPKYLALVAGTNLASWTYEHIRNARQNLKDKIGENQNDKR